MSTSVSASGPSRSILHSPKDWPQWYQVIQTKATDFDVWKHINPSTSAMALVPPAEPDSSNVLKTTGEGENQRVTVDVEAQQVYDFRYKVWEQQQRVYREKRKILADINDHVTQTCGYYHSFISRTTDLRDRLVILKKAAAPTTFAHVQEILEQYQTLKQGPKDDNVVEWLNGWEITLGEAKHLDMAIAKGLQPTVDFLYASKSSEPAFFQHWINMITTKGLTLSPDEISKLPEIPDGIEIAKIFRGQYSSEKTKSTFAVGTSLQGEEAYQPQKCYGGTEPHSPDKCYALHPEYRPLDWTGGRTRHLKELIGHLDKNASLKEKYAKPYEEITDILKKREYNRDNKDEQPPVAVCAAFNPVTNVSNSTDEPFR